MSSYPQEASWINLLSSTLGFTPGTQEWVFAAIGLVFIYCVIILPSAAMMSFLDRKLSADFQARVGPNRAGPAGVFQPLADLVKLLQKEAASTDWNWREALWLGVHTMALYSTVAVIPLGSMALLVDTDMSVFLPFWAALVLALGTMLLGFSQASVPGWFGGIRIAAQVLAGAFPSLVAVLCAGIHSGDYRWSAFVGAQAAFPLRWTAFSDPFQFIAFVVFVAGGLVMLAVPPMDAAVSLRDLHGGVSSHLFGRRLSLYRLGRFYGFFLWSVMATVIFLGAWTLPFGLGGVLRTREELWLLQLLETLWLLGKTFLLMLAITSLARVHPRGRIDQVTDFSWKVLSPFSLFALIGSALWTGWGLLR
ncbi:MAG: NADH-quinone oxidoreductase subunit H [Oligoflexia bacterium]|nr:NADH-quinone oxidoreductase subunit H [Oligoflexia bacterium]